MNESTRNKAMLLALMSLFSAHSLSMAQSSIAEVAPDALYHKAWKLIKDSYYDQTFAGQDWTSWEHRFDGKLKTPDDAHQAIKDMVATLKDDKTFFIADVQRESQNDAQHKKSTTDRQSTSQITSNWLNDKIAYIRVESMTLQCRRDLQAELQRYADAEGLVLDLRGTPGDMSLLTFQIPTLFSAKQTICYTVDAVKFKTKQVWGSDTFIFSKPVAILMDRGTTSGAEILAAALKDNKRAVTVGDHTRGQSKIAEKFKLEDGSTIMLTVAHWLTPNQVDIDGVGISPDIPAVLTSTDMAEHKGPWWTSSKKFSAESWKQDKQLSVAIAALTSGRIQSPESPNKSVTSYSVPAPEPVRGS